MKKTKFQILYRFSIVVLLSIYGSSVANAQIITTYAGNGIACFGGDGSPATNARISTPSNLVFDGTGNAYFADGGTRIRCVSTTGIITTIAGNGNIGYAGDGGPATAAEFNQLSALACDHSGNLYINDYGNNIIRKITSAGVISTVAGCRTIGYSGDGGPATAAQLSHPIGLATDLSGNLYIADAGNHRLRKVTTTGIISTVAGTGTSGFSGDGGAAISADFLGPTAIAIDSVGNIYLGDGYRIREISASTGHIATIAGNGADTLGGDGGPATLAALGSFYGIAVDAARNIYLSNAGSYPAFIGRIRKINTTGIISTFAGNGSNGFYGDGIAATAASLFESESISTDSIGNVYISDLRNYRIRKVDVYGIISTVAGGGTNGLGDGGPATNAEIWTDYNPSIASDRSGNLYVADAGNNRIRKITPAGIITTVAGNGDYGYRGDGGPATLAQFADPLAVAVDMIGNIYIVDYYNLKIRKVDTNGIIRTIAGNGLFGHEFGAGLVGDGGPATNVALMYPNGIAIDRSGNIYIKDDGSEKLQKIAPSGIIDSYGLRVGPVAVDSAGNLYSEFASDTAPYGAYVNKLSPYGELDTVAGNGINGYSGDGGSATNAELTMVDLDLSEGLAVDRCNNLFIVDGMNNVVRRVSPDGIISTIAGNGDVGFSGDGGEATAATFSLPEGVAVDAGGNIFINDPRNRRIRKISTCYPGISAIAGISTICNGSTTLFSDTAMGGTWSTTSGSIATVDSTGLVTGIAPGIDTLYYQKTNSCGSSLQMSVVTVDIPIHASLISGHDTLCPGTITTLSDTAHSGTWLSADPAIATISTSGIVSGVASGTVTMEYIVTNSCGSDTATATVVVGDHAMCNEGVNSAPDGHRDGNLTIFPCLVLK